MKNFVLPPLAEAEVDARLADMERLGRRNTREIGVPMFLVAEDLSGAAPARGPGDEAGRILAMLLAEGVEALRSRRPELSAEDVAKVVERIADRHFLSLGATPYSRDEGLHPAGAGA